MKSRLDILLGKYYGAAIVEKKDCTAHKQALIKALKEEKFREAATERLAQLEAIPDKRCFVSRVHKRILKEIFNGEGKEEIN